MVFFLNEGLILTRNSLGSAPIIKSPYSQRKDKGCKATICGDKREKNQSY